MSRAIISIEGNIGSGKSTLLSILQKHIDIDMPVIFLLEPVDEWETIKDENGITMLQKFYSDQDKYSFPFQMMAYISRLAMLKRTIQENPNAIIITERSLITDKYVFAKMLYDSGKIESVNYQIYQKWFHTFADDFVISGMIYVDSPPDVCSARITQRSRNGEESIPIDYLEKCHAYHGDMIQQFPSHKILTMDGRQNINEIYPEWVEQIGDFIKSLHKKNI